MRPWRELWLWLLLWAGAAADRFCLLKPFQLPAAEGLRWTRRSNELEDRREGTFLRLYCCADNFQQLLWFRESKDKKWVPLPDTKESSLRHLSSDNRTLDSRAVQERDDGRYRCEARNGSEVLRQSFKVSVKTKKQTNHTLVQPKFEIRVQRVGDEVQIDCSMMTDLTVIWYRNDTIYRNFPHVSKDDVKKTLPNVHLEPIPKPSDVNKQLRGQTLIISPIQLENFGQYDCYWKNTTVIRTVILKEGGYRKELKMAVICLVTLLIVLTVLMPFGWYWRVEIRLFWKDRFGRLEENDEKLYDVFVSYDAADAPFVLQILVPVLEDHFNYRCFAWERDSVAGDWIPETLVQSVRDSRRFLMILSPALLENRWCTFAMHVALEAVLQLRLHIICVKLHDIDWSQVQFIDKSANETIRQVLHVVRTVVWEPSKKKSMALRNQQLFKEKSVLSFNKVTRRKSDDTEEDIRAPGRSRFWRKLRLYLPPRRTLPLLSKPPSSPTSTKSLLSLPQGPDSCLNDNCEQV